GTYELQAVSEVGAQLLRTREATSFDYVRAGSPEFADPAVLVSQRSASTVAAYDLDADGNPEPATLRSVVEGVGGVTGGYTDPVSGDYLFTAGERVYVLHGFAAPTATLTVVKHVINDGGGTLEAGSFNVHVRKGETDVNGSPQPGSETGTEFHVPGTGTYTVTEDPVDGYARLFGGDCDATGSVTLAPSESKTCVLTNDDVEPKLTVVKHVVNDNGGTASAGDWTMHIMAGDPLMDVNLKSPFPGEDVPGTERTLSAGTFVVSESGGPEGYAATIGGECAPDGTITLALADTASCTITNNDIGPGDAPTLKLIKHVVNDDGGTKSASDFSLHVKGGGADVAGSPQPGSSSGTGYTLDPGTYGVSEDAVTGYAATFSGDCDAHGQVALAPGESKTCTITNDDSSGRIRNGHFERPVLPPGGHVTRTGSELTGWTVEGAGIDHIPQELWPAAEGRQSIDLNAEDSGSVWQDVATELSSSYTLRFSMAANPTCDDDVRELAVWWDGVDIQHEQFSPAGHSVQDPGWEDRTVTVRASGTTTRLGFQSLNGGACGAALDFVRLESAEAPPAAKLIVLRNDEAGGDVASGDNPKTLDCGATCSATYPDGTEVVLSPTPKPGWRFTGWAGAGCAGSPPTCTLTMTGDRTITATFERITHELHVERLGNGSGTVEGVNDPRIACGDTCDAPYDEGSSVTLRATPEAGHRFIGWRGAGCGGTDDCAITVDAEKTVEAIFVKGPLTWSLARDFRTSFDKPAANPVPDANAIPGVWSLGYSDPGDLDTVRTPSRYNLLSQRKTDANQSLVWSTPGNLGTDISMPEDAAAYARPHIVQVTPYGDRLQVVGWRSPVTGHVRVEGGLTGAPGGDGVRWFVIKDEAELARGGIGGGNCETQSFADGAGGASLGEIPVTAGQTLYFVIDPRGPAGTNDGPDIPSLDVNISEVAEGTPPPVSGRWELAKDMRRAPIQQN
ncbi:MAG: InlB B-repeat-containing protein, partial [Nocardioidaceae bacterium]